MVGGGSKALAFRPTLGYGSAAKTEGGKMKIFGKTLGEYIRFQKPFLVLILVVGLARLALSLAGAPNSAVRWLSMTMVLLAGVIYAGVMAPRAGFGYRHLLPVVFLQAALVNGITIVGILIAIATGHDNIFTAPEFSPPGDEGRGGFHVFGHVAFGTGIGTLLSFAISSLVRWIAALAARRSASASS
jgi:hypothetical protein